MKTRLTKEGRHLVSGGRVILGWSTLIALTLGAITYCVNAATPSVSRWWKNALKASANQPMVAAPQPQAPPISTPVSERPEPPPPRVPGTNTFVPPPGSAPAAKKSLREEYNLVWPESPGTSPSQSVDRGNPSGRGRTQPSNAQKAPPRRMPSKTNEPPSASDDDTSQTPPAGRKRGVPKNDQ